MIIATVVAVALGLAPINDDGLSQTVSGDYSAAVGRYSQSVDRRGTNHVRGIDARGIAYDLVVDRHGYVEANVGDRVVSFRVQEPA